VPTLSDGDRVLVNRLAYGLRIPFSNRIVGGELPRRGDVIVFAGDRSAMVKRVLGLPGDVVAFRDGSPIINGWPVPACDAGPFVTLSAGAAVRGRLTVEFLDGSAYLTIRTPFDDAAFPGYQVLPGELFVLGDDRGLSRDSRSWNGGRGGGVRLADVRGRVSRLAVGRLPDGRLDLARLLAPLGPRIRAPKIDLRETEALVAACLARPPGVTHPPAR
jgi:signal peptidase I